MNDNPLGRATDYPDRYDATLLHPIARRDGRETLGLSQASGALPFRGADLWTAWELSWLNPQGCPVVATATFSVPAESPNLVESKSLKLYLNSFSMSRFESARDVSEHIQEDLETATGSPVDVSVIPARRKSTGRIRKLPGRCIDYEDIRCDTFEVDAGLLRHHDETVSESLHSHVLRSLCPVTGQPDTGSVLVTYEGPRLDEGALLAYFASYRQHQDFHELCVERIFCDLTRECGTEQLSVYARYNRRGGIDINPFRSNFEDAPASVRLWRQ